MKFWQELKQGSFIITASGDTNQEQIKQYFDSTINQWTHSHNPNLNLNLPETHGADIQQLEGYEFKGDQEQAHVVLTQDCNINTTDTDYYPIRLANLILGAHPLSSRLGKLVRENSGLVYHIQSSLDNSTYHGGPFLVQAASKKSDAQKLLATIKQALSGFPDNITDKEIVLAKQILIRSFFIDWFKTNSNKASTLLDLELKNHDMNFIKNFAAMINSISREQIIDAFKKHINLSKLVEVVVDDKIKVNGQEVNTKFDAKEHKTKQSVALAA
jgi:predicted Zn-dependent peptidase